MSIATINKSSKQARRWLRHVVFGSMLVLGATSANATLVSFGNSVHVTGARGVAPQWEQVHGTATGADHLAVEARDGRTVARTDARQSAGTASGGGLTLEFTHYREAPGFGYTYSYGYQVFRADQAADFALSGFYELDGTAAIRLHVYLIDLVENRFLLRNVQRSRNVSGQRLELGQENGTYDNLLDGALQGRLVGGNRYAFWYQAFTYGWGQQGRATDSAGALSLTFSPGTQVPEPPALGLMLMGVAALAIGRGRRQRT
ncbi:MAG: PEP-CTERM sorting domain-containing protein [Pseudomonadota bacterium]